MATERVRPVELWRRRGFSELCMFSTDNYIVSMVTQVAAAGAGTQEPAQEVQNRNTSSEETPGLSTGEVGNTHTHTRTHTHTHTHARHAHTTHTHTHARTHTHTHTHTRTHAHTHTHTHTHTPAALLETRG